MGIHYRRFLREQDRAERRTRFYNRASIFCVCAVIVLGCFAFFSRADAATLQVYPNATYTHGGTVYPKDMASSLTVDGQTQQGGGVERYTFAGGAYSVLYVTPPGYRASLGDGCSGTAGADEDITCQVYVVDGAPIDPPAAVAPVVAPTVSIPQDVTQPSFSSGGAAVGPDIAILDDAATSTMTEQEQIRALQLQIIELYKILIALLMQKIAVIK